MLNSHSAIQPAHLIPRSTQMTIGSTVCITEGVAASILVMLPKDQWFYTLGAVLMIAMWCAIARFRTSKLGADISDLYFFEVATYLLAGIWFAMGKSTAAFWYPTVCISLLKLLRVYAPLGSTTQCYGWGVFGPMTYLFARSHAHEKDQPTPAKVYFALIGSIIIVAMGSVVVKMLPEEARVGMTWLIAILFEVVYGPRQLKALTNFVPQFLLMNQRESDKDTRIAQLEQEVAALKMAQQPGLGANHRHDEDSAKIVALLNTLPPREKVGLLKFATKMAENFGTAQPPNGVD